VIGSHRGEASYGEHCSKQNTAYLIAYEEWENSLSHKDRVLLGRAAAPNLEDYRAHSSKRMVIGALGDAAARSSASYSPDMAAAIDTDTDRLSEIAGLTARQALVIEIFLKKNIDEEAARRESRAITAIAGAFLKGTNSKLLAAGLAYASDLSVTSGMGTMQDWARENGVSRAAVSKVAKFWQRELELPAGSHMRDEQKCRAYSEAQTTKHWRNQKVHCAALEAGGQEIKKHE